MDEEDKTFYSRIALLSTELVAKPTQEGFDELYDLCKNGKIPPEIRKNAILSTCQVLIEVLPDYQVGKHAKNDNVSRDVRERRAQEQLLLNFARRFTQFCEMSACNRKNHPQLRYAAVKALSLLFEQKRHFNTGDVLSKIVVRLSCLQEQLFRRVATRSIINVFKSDPIGTFTLKVMAKIAETPTPKISSDLLDALKEIQLKPVSLDVRKPEVEDKDLEKELQSAGIIDNKTEQEHNQAAILEHLFGTVFRFLKETKSEEHFCSAMSVVKIFVPHLNIDVVPQIIDALKQTRFSLRASIIAANTALDMCRVAHLAVDLRSFYASVYARAYEALEDRQVLFEYLTLFELMATQIDKHRTAAFAKRLIMMALQAPTDVQGVILAVLRQMIMDSVSLSSAVAFEFEGEGEFNLMLDDPDSSNGPAAKYWELAHLCHSHNPLITELAKCIAKLDGLAAITDEKIRSANEKRDWSPRAVLELLDESKRIFDVRVFDRPAVTVREVKLFEF